MVDATNAADAAGGGEAVANVTVEIPGETPLAVREAARMLGKWRNQQGDPTKPEQPVTQEPSAPEAPPPAEESAAEADANPPQEDRGEASEDEAQEPPIEPPEAWKTEQKERWRSLPRDVQEYLTERELERERLL